MSSIRAPNPLWSLLGICLHGFGLFLLPFVVGLSAALVFETSEVGDTGGVLLGLAFVCMGPPVVMQFLGVVMKVGRERRLLRESGQLRTSTFLASAHRHIRILTARGWAALITGLWFVVLSLAFKWASLGLLAVLCLLLFYGVLGVSSFVSTFLVRGFTSGMDRKRSDIRREMCPAVVLAGESAEERFHFERVPVPPGFNLLVEDENPPELQTESRYAVGRGARRRRVSLAGRFRTTPRGLHRLGPARIWYQDVIGFTRVSVASLATAELKVIPRFRPLEIIDPPRSRLDAPDLLTRPHRYATDDHFRFKEYMPGDDTRRIHWRLSIRSGQLIVRKPESREISSRQVLLALDSFLPKGRMLRDAVGMGRILDSLVETWISLANELVDKGDRVTIAAAVDDGDGNIVLEQVSCNSGNQRRWQDLGARACWQGTYDLPSILSELGAGLHGIAVSTRFFAPPPEPMPGQSFTWIYLPPTEALGPTEPPFWKVLAGTGKGAPLRLISWLVRLPGPAGSDGNASLRQLRDLHREYTAYSARRRLRWTAWRLGNSTLEALKARGETVYKLEPGPRGHRLVGLVSGKSGGVRGAA